jgi:hypothetical protein
MVAGCTVEAEVQDLKGTEERLKAIPVTNGTWKMSRGQRVYPDS